MAQLASKEKMGYYPLPEMIAHLVRSNINKTSNQEEHAAVDLFAGCGTALKLIAGDICTTYGSELNLERAKLAKETLDHGLQGAAEFVRTKGKAALHYFNPPYDHATGGGRLETRFLEATYDHLAIGGLFVGVVPNHLLKDPRFLEILLTNHSNVIVRKFPEPEYQAFKQVIIFATRCNRRLAPYSDKENLRNRADNGFPTLKAGEFIFNLPYTTFEKFDVEAPTLSQALGEIEAEGIATTPIWRKATMPTAEKLEFTPLMSPMPGHIALLLAAGMVDGARLGDWLLKGYHYKYIEKIEKDSVDDDGNKVHELIEIERIAYAIVTLHLVTGEIVRYDSSKDRLKYERFVDEHLPELMQAVYDRYKPLYSGRYNRRMQQEFKMLHAPGSLPGHPPNGLLEPQKQVVAAMTEAFIRGEKGLFLEGEMGVGKTFIAISIMLLLTRYTKMKRIIVMCPPQLVYKWKREIERSGRDFGAKGFVCETVSDVEEAFNYEGISFVILSQQVAKNHSPWEPALWKKWSTWEEEKDEFADYGNNDNDTFRIDDDEPYEPIEVAQKQGMKSGKTGCCPNCGLRIKNEGSVYLKRGPATYDQQYNCPECNAPLWTWIPYTKGPRIALAYYINRKYAGYGLVNDEAHETKGGDTNIGYATRWLTSQARFVIQMTGTLSNGYASGLFHMAQRGIAAFRNLYDWDAVESFVDHHGLRQKTTREKITTYSSSTYGYGRASSTRTEEIPGTTPGIVALLLPCTAFLYTEQVSKDLPSYDEYQLPIVAENYPGSPIDNLETFIDGKLRDVAGSLARKGDMSLLSIWSQMSIGYLDGSHLGDKVAHKDLAFELPPLPDVINEKDNELLDAVRRENSNGRRCLMYWMQVNRRDGMPRFGAKLEAEDILYAILRTSDRGSRLPNGELVKVDNKSREEFILDAVSQGTQVLMCSPDLVKTGLDLIQFPTIFFVAPHYSILLLKQASRRSWRLGQTEPVRIVWAYWKDTRQQEALAHIAKKLRAASLIDGRAITGLSSMGAEDSFLYELVARATDMPMPDLPYYNPPGWGNEKILPAKRKVARQESENGRGKSGKNPAGRNSFREWANYVDALLSDPQGLWYHVKLQEKKQEEAYYNTVEIPQGIEGSQMSLF